jgi:thiamine biosynthesis protein ThiS
MQVTLNGETKVLSDGMTIAALLQRLELAPIRVAVEVNEELVSRRAFGQATLAEGDRVEIVTFVGGG